MSEPLLSKTQGGDPWKARIDRVFARALVLPLFLALALLSWLLLDTLYRSFSVQVVRSDVGLSQTFPLGTAWQEALRAALLQEGYTEEEAEAMLKDPKELRAAPQPKPGGAHVEHPRGAPPLRGHGLLR
jgi:phosphate transport system permease protein